MKLTPSDIYTLYSPGFCERRVFLAARGEERAEPDEFEELIHELGIRHEKEHLASFRQYTDISLVHYDRRVEATREAIARGDDVIYQGVFEAKLPGTEDTVAGSPDFLIRRGKNYIIRDCKLARHAEEGGRHGEIVFQLQLYGWLFKACMKKKPAALEVYLGDRTTVGIPVADDRDVLELLNRVRSLELLKEEPWSPVGWSKCSGCGFEERCWQIAEQQGDPAVVYGVDQATAIALRDQGVYTIDELLREHSEETLHELKKQRGDRLVRVGKASRRILQQTEALKKGKPFLIKPLELPSKDNWVMFDLEGLPPQFDELDKVYLWGMQVFGKRPGDYLPSLAGFGEQGDREGWDLFLKNSEAVFREYGDIPFVHWNHYETTKLREYIARYKDTDGIAGRVLENCLDLLKVTRDCLVLPEPSYSLKVVEQRAGFERTMEEFGGNWSIAQYVRAVETEDEELRREIMVQIQRYNQEDLAATWAVLEWVRRFSE